MLVQNDDYTYPDQDEKITSALIKLQEPFPGYWNQSERKIIELMKAYIVEYLLTHQDGDDHFLDAGCGEGRMVMEFSECFSSITAADPDRMRLNTAKERVQETSWANKVAFQNVMVEDLAADEDRFDVILFSHVLQHVHTDAVEEILRKFSRIIKKDGILFITTCHSVKPEDYYTKSYFEGSAFKEGELSKEEFNTWVTNAGGILPAHFFTRDHLEECLKRTGFTVFDFKVYHILESIEGMDDQMADRDEWVNRNPRLQRSNGRDLFIAARRSR
jgi:ubiquinone/menaquinone biosynthesis C-methylase UbiE